MTPRASRALILLAAAVLAACGVDKPTIPDGNGRVSFVVVDTSGLFPGGNAGVPLPLDSVEVRLKSRTHEFSDAAFTDPNGIAYFKNLVSGWYDVFARTELKIENNDKLFTGGFDFRLAGDEDMDSTVFVNLIPTSELMINEIFYCGSDYSSFYFYGQFVELYNSADTTLYLDGIILTRQMQTYYPDQDDVDYVRALYAYQFPGTPVTGREYPIEPGQFVVIAADAIDHTQWCAKSIDLSHADWECFNPLGSDYDNPAVPNLLNIKPDHTTDYMINLSHNAVVICTGEEYELYEYEPDKFQFLIPIRTVIDGIEYASSSTSTKELTARVDAGFAGLGNTKYSGQSAERKEVGLDTNDSSFDFELAYPPTPGYSHAKKLQ